MLALVMVQNAKRDRLAMISSEAPLLHDYAGSRSNQIHDGELFS